MSLADIHTEILNIEGNTTILGRDRITITRTDGGTFGPFGGRRVEIIDEPAYYLVITNEGNWRTAREEDVIDYVRNGCFQSIM